MFGRADMVAVALLFTLISSAVAEEEAAPRKTQQVLLNAEQFEVAGHSAFVMMPARPLRQEPQPWVFYAPTLSRYPDSHESWMHQKFLDAGIAVAGIDVGEAYGSPKAFPQFDALYSELTENRHFAARLVLLGRSRGGLWVSSWAIQNPDRVAAIAGIYPVFDLRTYPGLDRAAPAYGLSTGDLESQLVQLNPIEGVARLASAGVPVSIIHGADDKVVPLKENSAELKRRYELQGRGDLVELIVVPEQGHNFWPGFFRCESLVEFVIAKARPAAAR